MGKCLLRVFGIAVCLCLLTSGAVVLAQDDTELEAGAPGAGNPDITEVEPPAVTYGEIEEMDISDLDNPVITVKDRRTGEVNQILIHPRTRILKTINLDVKDVKKGEFARVIYRKDDEGNVARIVFVREAIVPAPAPERAE
ncbi:MAG: hypothetical protein ABH885_05895 [Candidatus Omnitrophota bacterium]